MIQFLPFFLVLLLVAAIMRQTTVITILYLIGGLFLLGRWWSVRSLRSVDVQRSFIQRAFLNQIVPIKLTLINRGWLPVVWLNIHESLPVGMIAPSFFQQVITIGPKGEAEFIYRLDARKRGYYPIGPLFLNSGDLFGMSEESQVRIQENHLIVYPHIEPIHSIGLPSRSPFGNIHTQNPIYEDPSQAMGKRDYSNGDSLRSVDWKASASVGRLQVKQFEPSIALDLMICLNLNNADYEERRRHDMTELAITIAASVANWSVRRKHSTGLITNGIDPTAGLPTELLLPSRKGTAQLTHILDLLARIEAKQGKPFLDLLKDSSLNLPWGTTIVLITGTVNQSLISQLIAMRRRGLNAIVVPVGSIPDLLSFAQQARHFGFPVYPVQTLFDMEAWR